MKRLKGLKTATATLAGALAGLSIMGVAFAHVTEGGLNYTEFFTACEQTAQKCAGKSPLTCVYSETEINICNFCNDLTGVNDICRNASNQHCEWDGPVMDCGIRMSGVCIYIGDPHYGLCDETGQGSGACYRLACYSFPPL